MRFKCFLSIVFYIRSFVRLSIQIRTKMKAVIAFTFLIVSVIAIPQKETEEHPIEFRNERIATRSVVSVIEAISQAIRAAGLDPLYIEKKDFALPVPAVFNSAIHVEELLFSGLSNIVVHNINYDIAGSRLTFDVELPLIHFSVGAASAEATLFGRKFDIKTSGLVDVRNIRVSGEVGVNVSVLSGITLRNLNVTLSLGAVETKVQLSIQGKDYSDKINTFLSSKIPAVFKEYNVEINDQEILLSDLIGPALKNSRIYI